MNTIGGATRSITTALALGAIAAGAVSACGATSQVGEVARSTSPASTAVADASSTVSADVPAGFPRDWAAQAIAAATAALETCAKATTLAPPSCPQAVQPQTQQNVTSATWTILGAPLRSAVAMPPQPAAPDSSAAASSLVTVLGRSSMRVSYTAEGGTVRPYTDYAGGLVEATMTWDGHSFQQVAFQPPAAISSQTSRVAPFTRPAEVTDETVLQATARGFHDCATLNVPLASLLATPFGPVVPNCPQGIPGGLDPNTVSAAWQLNADPTQGALVSFDPDKGDFVVTGSYDMTLRWQIANVPYAGPRTTRSSGTFVATLAWDGAQLTLLDIAPGH